MKSLLRRLKQQIAPNENIGLRQWQQRSLLFVLVSVSIVAIPALTTSIVRSIQDGLWINRTIFICCYSFILVFIFCKNISFPFKAWTTITIFFLLGILSLFSIGPAGSGKIWFYSASMLATLIIGFKAGLFVLVLEMAFLFMFSKQLQHHSLRYAETVNSSGIWFTTSITFLFLSITSIVAMSGLIRGLSMALSKTKDSEKQLIDTTIELNKQIAAHHESKISLMESEQRWEFALEGSGDGVWDWNLQEDTVYFSPRWKTMLGYKETEIENRINEWFNRIHPEDRETPLTDLDNCIEGKQDTFQNRYRLRCKDKSYLWIMDRGKIMEKDANGKPVRIIGTHSDISFMKKLEDEQIIYENRLQQAQKIEAIGTLAGGIAHDFNNILTPILGNTELILRTCNTTPEVREHLNKNLASAERARELVKQILTFSRQDLVNPKPINISSIVKEILKLLRSTIPASIIIKNKIDSNCGVIYADPTQIHQVLMNLTTNAYHAMEETGGEITISLTPDEISDNSASEKPWCTLQISDTGTGISDTIRGKIFDPFFTTKKEGRGTGLGLSVVHGIITNLNGTIDFESSQNAGTTFTIRLPLIERQVTSESPVTDSNIKKGSGHILLVDDEKDIIEVLEKMVQFLGYTSTSFSNSPAALEIFKKNPDQYDVVITDMEMPNLSGGKLAEQIKQIRPNLPVILCSGFSEKVSEEKLFTEFIDDFMAKPVSITELSEKLRIAILQDDPH